MQIVIDIPEETYEYWKEHSHEYVLSEAIKNGIPLPKYHGRLIDADAYKENVFKKFPCNSSDDRNMRRLTELALKDAQTIIESDGGNEE